MFRIGFACKYKAEELNKTKKEIKEEESFFNTTSTTLMYLNKLSYEEKELKMINIIKHNFIATKNLLNYVSNLPKELHMLRITSDLLPFYTHKDLSFFYKDKTVIDFINKELLEIGDFARKNNIRLSFHPGQFCVLASSSEDIVKRSIQEFEYHTMMAKKMGYAKTFQDFKCNIHISGTDGVSGFKKSYNKLSPESRNIITIENTEFKYGIDDCLLLRDFCPIVLDVHHHWINEESLIAIKDKRIKLILDSWRGVRPTMHYSQSREEYFDIKKSDNKKLDIKNLLLNGLNKKKLSAHSDMMWNNEINKKTSDFLPFFDIMIEAKNKNLSAIDFLKKIKRPT